MAQDRQAQPRPGESRSAGSRPGEETASPSGVILRGVSKRFGDVTAVADLDLDVRSGEFLAMLGPSGSGKTTVLRMIAGFEDVTTGQILLDGRDVTHSAPFDRQVNTVFQDYALFPHLSIAENVGYGLRVRGMSKDDRVGRVRQALEQVRLTAAADRMPHQLSGGQRQRIALARALILQPRVLLLDEPLGALDKQLREEMQIELKQIQREVGITFVFVTHDQEEALTLSDRIVVFNEGRVEQIGTAREVYEFPQTRFVAGFLGTSNLIPAQAARAITGTAAGIAIRPERVRLAAPDAAIPTGDVAVAGVVLETVYTGPATRFVVETPDGLRIIAERHNDHHPTATGAFMRGDAVQAVWTADHASVVP